MRGSILKQWPPSVAVLMTAALAALTWKVYSDEPPAADKPHRVPVAVLDVAKVFKQARDFNGEMSRIKTEIEVFEREVNDRQAEILKLVPKEAKEGSAPTSGADVAKATELRNKLEADIAAKKKGFLAEEALVYFKFYGQIEKAVAEMAKARDIGTVVRVNFDAMDPTDRASVLQGVNRAVVYNAAPDLTADLLAVLNAPKP